jgi:uncharacterized protein YdeI (YjbR/CyaY-like superfamily)
VKQFELVQPESRGAWRSWLAENHHQSDGCWLVFRKKAAGGSTLFYDDAVEEALCFGWIDSLPRKLDEERHMLLMTPRKPKSPWSKLNKERVEKLESQGCLTQAGIAKIERAKFDGSWTIYDAAESFDYPSDLVRALSENPTAEANFFAFSPSSRKGIL